MRRYSLFLMLLCMHCIARGQTGFDYRYWFDNDYRTVYTGHSSTGQWQMEADLDGLSESLHAIHLQVVDAKGVESAPVTRFFLKVRDTSVNQGYYWFDGDRTAQQQMGQVQGMFTIDVSRIADGFHTFYYQVVGKDGSLSSIVSRSFYKVVMPEYARFRCWVDEDLTTMTTGKYTGAPVLVDISHLSEGYHVMRVQVEGVTPSAVVSRPFVKIPQTEGVEYLKCLCVVDDKLFREENVSSTGGVIDWNLDVSGLPQGFHHMQVQVITPSGAATGTYNAYFLRTTTTSEMADMKCVYAIDGAEFNTEAGSMTNGVFHCDLDVSHLEDGLHRIAYKLTNGKGVETKTQTQFFMKTPLGGNGIKEYWYWLNDSTDQVSKVQLAERTNPFKLISLLPVPKHPISSKLFQFEMSDNQPMVYAKNNFHIRFYDAAGRFTDKSAQFTDYSVKQEVEPVGELQTTQTFPKVAENDIRWYTMQVAPGDTAAFRLSQAATLQVFAPSGKEVFKTSESTSVQWGGIHTWEDGTYYVAVHDVTGSRSNMTLDYMHMDKYDVVDWDVHTVGNGGCSTITFKGNGFRDLYRVDLYTAVGDSIHSVDISHDSDAETSVTFDFSGAELGVYNAVFHFTQEDKHFANIVAVEEAVDIELATNVTFPSTFLRGTSTTYTIKITNKGNMTAYQVPLDIQIATANIDAITQVKFSDNVPKLTIDWMDTLSISKEDVASVRAFIEEKGDLLHFITTFDSISNRYVKFCLLAVDIAPKSTYIITLNIASSETVNVQAKIPSVWNSYSFGDIAQVAKRNTRRRASAQETMCCYREKVECVMNIIVSAADFASFFMGPQGKLATCIADLGNTMLQFSYDVWCGEEHGGKDMRKAAEDLVWDAVNGIVGCLCNIPGLSKLGTLDWVYQHIYNNIKTTMDCVSSLSQKIPNCPPDPPGGGSSTPQPPSDPNDIYGYLSEAGSKFMTDEVAKVNYTIEFENDTAFAQASAHTIVIRDTLDSRYFDLTSFLPTCVKIGEREAFLDEAADVKTVGNVTRFLKTIDMRPEINAIAQVEGEYSQQTGIAKWTFTSLDPMTMEPTDDLMQGILPVNYNGTSGIGEVMFEVGVKPNKADGTQIPNRAGIVFDYEESILTPTWTNIVDATAPESHVTDVKMLNDSTAAVSIAAADELSGPWRYDVYVQYGEGSAWWKAAENVPIDTTASVKVYEGINHGFYVIVTDSAGNVEQKEATREFTLDVFGSQVETNTKIQLSEGWNWMSHNQNTALTVEAVKPKAQRIMSQTEELYKDSKFGWMGDLDELLPTQMYKVQMTEASEVQLSGLLFNAAFRSIPLLAGWNWIGYPVANTMAVSEAMAKFEAEEGDALIGRDGLATFTDGQWTGTLTEMTPGRGYMYRSMSDKNLFLNATAQASSRRSNAKFTIHNAQLPEGWTVDKSCYPSVMGVMAELRQKGEIADADEWLLAAFCGDECRGIAQTVNGVLMINVLGHSGEAITFRALHRESGEIVAISEQEPFRADLLGSMRQPYQLTMGELTGISEIEMLRKGGNENVYDMQGRKVDADHTAKGVYIVTDGKNSGTQKVVRK